MIRFDLWTESFILGAVFSVIVLVPCILVMLIGRKTINKLGQYPTRTPAIQMSIFLQLVAIEIVGFFSLLAFYNFFSN